MDNQCSISDCSYIEREISYQLHYLSLFNKCCISDCSYIEREMIDARIAISYIACLCLTGVVFLIAVT